MPTASTEPQGFSCPGCGQAPTIALDQQAFCGNDGCAVMAWNPTRTLAELAEDIQHVDLSGEG